MYICTYIYTKKKKKHYSSILIIIFRYSPRDLYNEVSLIVSNRYGLTNEDLNRRWSNPNQVYHPVIYHTKGLMEYCTRVLQRPPHVFVDYHGHSRRKNVFLFGCSRSGSWSAADRTKPDQPVQYLVRNERGSSRYYF